MMHLLHIHESGATIVQIDHIIKVAMVQIDHILIRNLKVLYIGHASFKCRSKTGLSNIWWQLKTLLEKIFSQRERERERSLALLHLSHQQIPDITGLFIFALLSFFIFYFEDLNWNSNSDNSAEVNLQDNRVSMLNDGTLMIHNTVDSDKGTYQCVVRTPNQEIRTNKVQLTYSRGTQYTIYINIRKSSLLKWFY